MFPGTVPQASSLSGYGQELTLRGRFCMDCWHFRITLCPKSHIMNSLPILKAPYLPWGKSAHQVMMQGHRLSDASFMQTTRKRGPHAQRWQEAGTVGCKGIPNLIKKDKHQPCKSKPPGPPSACLLLTLYCKANEESRDIAEYNVQHQILSRLTCMPAGHC